MAAFQVPLVETRKTGNSSGNSGACPVADGGIVYGHCGHQRGGLNAVFSRPALSLFAGQPHGLPEATTMLGHMRWTSLGFAILSLALFSGCNEGIKKDRDLLQQENSRLAQELDDCRSQLQAAGQGDAACQQQLDSLRRENQNLASQLQDCLNRPLPQPTQQPVAEGWTPVPGGAMIALEGDVLFGSGKAILRDEAKPTLQKIAAQIKANYANDDIIVYGHTDADPIKKSGWKDNYELSAQRALSVVRFMMSQGLSGTQLVAGGCGEHRPRGTNATAQGKQQNRRVEVYALNTRSIAPQR